jgi:MoaA/NifB/PqqE/SkfB family radical SAM enzyme
MSSPVPLWLWVDATRSCNLACRLCYTKRSHADEHLSPTTFRRFLDVLLNSGEVVIQKFHFNWRGDPLMNPALPELMAELEARNPDFSYEFHTNGGPLTPETAKALTAVARRGEFFVSIDGGTERSHDFNRGPGSFRQALRAARLLLDARGKQPTPWLGIYQLNLGEDESAYDPEFRELVRRVDGWVRIDPIHPGSGRRIKVDAPARVRTRTLLGDQSPSEPPDELRPSDRWWTHDIAEDDTVPHDPCFWAGNALFVAPNGDVSVCLLSHTRDGVLGNLLQDELPQILQRARDFRASIERLGRAAVPHCSGCRMAPGVARPLRPAPTEA